MSNPFEAKAGTDFRRKAVAIGLELAKNAVRAKTLQELQFILVNDTKALLPFDRSLLIEHFQGKSALAAANNQPKLEPKSGFVRRVNSLSSKLKEIRNGLVIFAKNPKTEGLSAETAAELTDYIEYSKCSCMIIVPLSVYDNVIGHLVLEFFDDVMPGEIETLTLMNMVPFFSSALMDKWMAAKDGSVQKAFQEAISDESAGGVRAFFRSRIKVLGVILALIILGLCLPVTLKVGGKAEVAPEYEYCSFVQMDGIVEKILAKEGDVVKKDQVVGSLEAKEIDYKIRETLRLLESYNAEMQILRNQGAENPAKLAESQLVAIKSVRSKQDLEFLNWQRQFLNIRSPVNGVIITKKLESLVGKKLKAGEIFCKVAPENDLLAEIFIRESDVGFVEKGQPGEVFFNYQPNRSYTLKVKDISPKSEALERMGAVYRVKADFITPPPNLKPGMQGIAHIDTKKASLWFVLTRRMQVKIKEMLLFF